jgi:hypothetical protein
MTTKRKPTLKQLFTAWKKHEKKCEETRKEKWNLESMANEIGFILLILQDKLIIECIDGKLIVNVFHPNHQMNPVASVINHF